MTVEDQRNAIVTEAKSWLGTKFEDKASLKGVAVDCAHLIGACFNNALSAGIVVRNYFTQWHLNKDSEEIFVNDILTSGFIETRDHKPGDLVVARVGRKFCHGGIVISWPIIIHAEGQGCGRGLVVQTNANANWYYNHRRLRFFSWGAWHINGCS